jgi:hypothetical protein
MAPIDEAVIHFPIPERTPQVTKIIFMNAKTNEKIYEKSVRERGIFPKENRK